MFFVGIGQFFCLCLCFLFDIEGGVWIVIVLIADHCLFIYLDPVKLLKVLLLTVLLWFLIVTCCYFACISSRAKWSPE